MKPGQIAFALLTISALITGAGVGYVLKTQTNLNDREIAYLRLPGDLFTQALQLLALPLLIVSVISGLATIRIQAGGWVLVATIAYVLVTNIIAIVCGFAFAMLIRPGDQFPPQNFHLFDKNGQNSQQQFRLLDLFADALRNSVPTNFVRMTIQSKKLLPNQKELAAAENGAENGAENFSAAVFPNKNSSKFSSNFVEGENFLGIICISILIGFAMRKIGAKGNPLLDICNSLQHLLLSLIHFLMWYSPLGLFSLVATTVILLDSAAILNAWKLL